jgi:hypothetical protein
VIVGARFAWAHEIRPAIAENRRPVPCPPEAERGDTLKFRGYEVFRFGHDELRDRDHAQPLLANFFATLLDRPPGSRVPQSAGG